MSLSGPWMDDISQWVTFPGWTQCLEFHFYALQSLLTEGLLVY